MELLCLQRTSEETITSVESSDISYFFTFFLKSFHTYIPVPFRITAHRFTVPDGRPFCRFHISVRFDTI